MAGKQGIGSSSQLEISGFCRGQLNDCIYAQSRFYHMMDSLWDRLEEQLNEWIREKES